MGYWLVVVAEVGAIAAGLVVLNGPLHAPQAAVAWIALVVGIHFIALAVVWNLLFFNGLGAALMLCGVAGLVLAATGSLSARSTSWAVSCPEPSSSAWGCGAPREALTLRWPGQCRKPNGIR